LWSWWCVAGRGSLLVHKACFAPDVSNDVVQHVDSTTMILGEAGGWNEAWGGFSELL
jgi:hypothetical protein